MALTHLVDTSVLTRLGQTPIREVLEPRAARGELARAGISDLEIGYSARGEAEWHRLMTALEVFELIETSSDHLRRARQVKRLSARHQRGRKVPDLLVAAAAEASDLTVLHYDADFDRIAAVTGQPSEWVVRPGSVD